MKSHILNFIQKAWGFGGRFFGGFPTLSLLLPILQIANQMSIAFSCFQQSLLKSSMCVHDKYTPVATCRRNKPQHENTKSSLFSYVNKSPDGSFVRQCLLILVFFLRPWDSPGKNPGVGCHFLLQCMKVKRESESLCPTSWLVLLPGGDVGLGEKCQLTPLVPCDCGPG